MTPHRISQLINIDVCDRQASPGVEPGRLREAIRTVLSGEHVLSAEVSVALVDNAEMHALNRRFLKHDFPTDVLSFLLGGDAQHLEGELILSVEMARQRAAEFGWAWQSELLLYAIHGTLHLAGYRDHDPASRAVMRDREQHYLRQFETEGCNE